MVNVYLQFCYALSELGLDVDLAPNGKRFLLGRRSDAVMSEHYRPHSLHVHDSQFDPRAQKKIVDTFYHVGLRAEAPTTQSLIIYTVLGEFCLHVTSPNTMALTFLPRHEEIYGVHKPTKSLEARTAMLTAISMASILVYYFLFAILWNDVLAIIGTLVVVSGIWYTVFKKIGNDRWLRF